MAVTHTAVFAQTPKTASAVATTAFALTGSSSLLDDAPANTVLLMTAGSDGALVTALRAVARATNTATMGAFFIRKSGDAAGLRRLFTSITISAQTVSNTAAVTGYAVSTITENTPLRLAAGDEIYVGLGVTQANGIVFHAEFVNY